jgi:hypothetical protein
MGKYIPTPCNSLHNKKKKLFKQPNNLHRPKLQSFNPIFKITSTIDYKIFTKKLQ